ncbi:LlaJI restriction endonuclease [Mammaliicoccus lentus]|uniref:LlaJI family restriction endonuclease n=1 Tax=Mammaliicoccus lentus TaxID=42858 RepID=UPI00085BB2BD|nr:LlaJI family restriction endonuclease [Mammaliicoccus lentus]SCU44006.1 LlaJI restriction endonuclease [Mammaliicoccus lentus]
MNAKYKLEIWTEGKKYSKVKVPTHMVPYFSKLNDENSLKLESVGIHFYKDGLHVMLPKNSDEQMFNEKKHIDLLIKGLTDNKLENSSSYDEFDIVKTSDLFKVIKWLIDDFKKNGIYFNTNIFTNKKKGKINWRKTIKKSMPFVNGNNLAIMEFYRDKKIKNLDDISLIHIHVINNISQSYGALFKGFQFKGNNLKIDIRESKRIERILKTAITTSNITREIYLFKNLLLYLQLIQSNNDNISISTKNFHVFFENIFKYYINHDKSLMEYIPSAKWNFKLPDEKFNRVANNNQIPDALVENSGFLDIYDPKYYDLSYLKLTKSTNSVPLDWYSVSKQFFYSLSFDYEKSGLKKGENYFVFPYTSENFKLINIGDITIDDNIYGKQKINILLIDVMKLLDYYLHDN